MDELERTLERGGVTVRRESPCSSLRFNSDGKAELTAAGGVHTFDHVISAVPAAQLAQALPGSQALLSESLGKITSVSVAVVNLEYEGDVLPVEGFGFLVPSREPLDVLGVIFDSCAFPQNDRPGGGTTRLTVSTLSSCRGYFLRLVYTYDASTSSISHM